MIGVKRIIKNIIYVPEKYKDFIFKNIHNIPQIISDKGSKQNLQKNDILKKDNENNINESSINGIKFGINNNKNEKKYLIIEKTNDLSIEQNNKENKNLFQINLPKKAGRKPKSSIAKSLHTKFSKDNILRKVKVKFFHKLINYLNSIIISKNNNRLKKFKPLIGKISQDNTINFNQKLLNSKLKDIFSLYEINGKFRLFGKNYNKIVVDKIYEEKIKELIDVLEMTFLEVFIIFRDLDEKEKLKGLEKVDSVIREISNKEEFDEKYINDFKETVMRFETFYFNKIGRKDK
jgi:hypothetical protein